jgi:hypothetical protein
MTLSLALSLIVLLTSLGLPSEMAQAASPPEVSLAPATNEVALRPGQAESTFAVTIANQSRSMQSFRLGIADFGTLDESGGVTFIGPSAALNYKYGLAGWVTMDRDSVSVAPSGHESVSITVHNADKLTPGGHYGAVLVNQIGTAVGNVQLRPILSSLIFVTKMGGEHYDLGLDAIRLRANWLQLPGSVQLRFHNIGNVHAVPRGIVSVIDPRGREIERGIINQASAITLPESFRLYAVGLNQIGLARWPGRYSVKVQYRYDGYGSFATKTTSFYFVNLPAIAIVVLLVILLFGVVWYARGWITKRR